MINQAVSPVVINDELRSMAMTFGNDSIECSETPDGAVHVCDLAVPTNYLNNHPMMNLKWTDFFKEKYLDNIDNLPNNMDTLLPYKDGFTGSMDIVFAFLQSVKLRINGGQVFCVGHKVIMYIDA